MDRNSKLPIVAAFAAATLAWGACAEDAAEEQAEQTGEAEPSGDTLAEALSGAEGLDTVTEALGDVGLTQVFDGAGSYTILAPNDEACDGEGVRVTSEDGSTAMITGEALRASNGVAIPLDGVLKSLSPPA